MSRFLESGNRNVPMTLQKQVVVPVDGEPGEVHLDVDELLYGNVWTPTGDELVEARKLGVRNPVKIRTLFREDITADDQLTYNGKVIKIQSVVDEGERRTELVITGEARP